MKTQLLPSQSLVGVAGGATRSAIGTHQARRNNMADVTAKDGSQVRDLKISPEKNFRFVALCLIAYYICLFQSSIFGSAVLVHLFIDNGLLHLRLAQFVDTEG